MISDLLSQLQPFVVMVLATALQSLPLVVGVAGTCRPKFFDPCSGDIVTEQECRERNLGCQWRPQESKTCAYGINCTSFESYSHCYFAKAGCYWDWDPILSPISTTNNNVDDTDEGGSTSENYLLLLFLIVILVLFVGIFHWYAHGDPHIRTGGGSSQGRPAEPPKRAPNNGNQNMETASDTEEVVDDIEASIPMVSAEMILPKTTNDHDNKSMVVGATYSSNSQQTISTSITSTKSEVCKATKAPEDTTLKPETRIKGHEQMKTIDLDSCKEEVEDDIEASLPVVSKDILPNTNDHKGEVCKATKAKDPTLKPETSIKEVTKKLGNQDSDDRHNDHHRRHQHHGARKPKYHERVQSKSTTTPSSQATTLQAAAGNNGVVIVKKVINEHVVEITEMLNGQMIRQSLRRFQPGERETL